MSPVGHTARVVYFGFCAQKGKPVLITENLVQEKGSFPWLLQKNV